MKFDLILCEVKLWVFGTIYVRVYAFLNSVIDINVCSYFIAF